jgi:Flp pilus assembly protein CpaB
VGTAAIPRFGWRRSWLPIPWRRRLLAAGLAGAAALVLLSSTRPAKPPDPRPVSGQSAQLSGLAAGQVAAPVRLVDPAVGGLLQAGAVVNVLSAPESPTGPADEVPRPATTVAEGVRVLAVPRLIVGDSTGTLVVIAVTPVQARALAGAQAGGRLSITLSR